MYSMFDDCGGPCFTVLTFPMAMNVFSSAHGFWRITIMSPQSPKMFDAGLEVFLVVQQMCWNEATARTKKRLTLFTIQFHTAICFHPLSLDMDSYRMLPARLPCFMPFLSPVYAVPGPT